ncbi:MAG: HNH endonuclease [Proteobacteria bacterium]|nr:HNH endonuclease [Pseudomonadota bacterium]
MSTIKALRQVCEMLSSGDSVSAAEILQTAFPPPPAPTHRSSWPPVRLTKVFIRDGFTDRYFGEPLVFPGTLRALSVLAPGLFPYHRNWKQSLTHPAYWSHYPTIDHIVPLARGGKDDESNVVTTSMLRNAAKSNWLLSELGWPTASAPLVDSWDGLLVWFCREYEKNEKLRHESSLRQWYKAAKSAH